LHDVSLSHRLGFVRHCYDSTKGCDHDEGDWLAERFEVHVIALENMRGPFSLTLGIGAAGFSEGMACAVPDHLPIGTWPSPSSACSSPTAGADRPRMRAS